MKKNNLVIKKSPLMRRYKFWWIKKKKKKIQIMKNFFLGSVAETKNILFLAPGVSLFHKVYGKESGYIISQDSVKMDWFLDYAPLSLQAPFPTYMYMEDWKFWAKHLLKSNSRHALFEPLFSHPFFFFNMTIYRYVICLQVGIFMTWLSWWPRKWLIHI